MFDSLIIFVAQYLIFSIGLCFLLYGLFRVPKGEQKTLLVSIVCALVVGIVLVKLAGALHLSPRPFVLDNTVPLFPHVASNGFPSNHTAVACALALLLWRYNGRLSVILFFLALLIGSARVFANVHHMQDIVAGVLVAGASVAVALFVTDILLAKKHSAPEG